MTVNSSFSVAIIAGIVTVNSVSSVSGIIPGIVTINCGFSIVAIIAGIVTIKAGMVSTQLFKIIYEHQNKHK